MADTLTTLSQEAKQFYDRNLLYRAKPILKMAAAGQQRNIPKNSGNQVSYRRFNALSTATTALTEAVSPASASLSVTEITGTVAQYGNYVTVSDSLDLMAIDMVIKESTDVLGENAAQSVEEIVRAEIQAGTSVLYGTSSGRGSQDASHPITFALVRKAVRNLLANDTLPYTGQRGDNGMGGLFMGIIHPLQWYDLVGDTTVLNTAVYSDPDKIYKMEIPTLASVMWIVTTKAPKFAGAGSGGVDVYGALVFGQNAYGVVNVAGTGKFQTQVQPLGSGGTADPLAQRATIGWKSWQLPKMLNNNFITRIETGVSA